MTPRTSSIVLISSDAGVASRVAPALRALDGVEVSECETGLQQANGRVRELAGQNDLIVFRTGDGIDSDIAAVQALMRDRPVRAKILALTDPDATLTDIRRLTRAGVAEVLPDTVGESELEEAVRKLTAPQAAPAAAAPGREGRVIPVVQARGGIGATTVAVNLADRLQNRGGRFRKTEPRKVAIVDLDLQFGSVAGFLDLEPNPALYQMATGGIEPDTTFLRQSMVRSEQGLHVLAAPDALAPLDALKRRQIHALVTGLQKEFDYIVVDLPRALVDWVGPVLEQSERLLIVSDSSVPAVQHARRLIDFYSEVNLKLRIDMVMNHEKKPLVQGRRHVEAARVLERKLRYWLPDDDRAASEALDRGKPLSMVARRSRLTRAIGRIAEDLAADFGGEASNATIED